MIHDALVIGGGPAGATVAWLLARAGWSVALLEKSSFPRRKVCGEFISATTLPLLRLLGLDEMFMDMAGPPVQEVGLYTGEHMLTAPMPVNREYDSCWGRALGREHLDSLLLDNAERAGVNVIQPCSATAIIRDKGISICTANRSGTNTGIEIQARVLIAAHGSWDKGKLTVPAGRQKLRSSDLLAFKAHFVDADLPPALMPLLAFPGGYGGMVHTDQGRVSLSCCIRRDTLQQCRNGSATEYRAADATFTHIMENCYGVRQTLHKAGMQGPWLATGPVQPGIRTLYKDGTFATGNAAGEAHPVVAEGISMAMQGAWLLAGLLIARRAYVLSGNMDETGHAYAQAWYRSFAPRLYLSTVIAQLAMRPTASKLLLPLFQHVPGLLTFCTRLSGKTRNVVPAFP